MVTSRTLFKVRKQNKIRCAQFEKITGMTWRKTRFQTTLEGAECLRRSDTGWFLLRVGTALRYAPLYILIL